GPIHVMQRPSDPTTWVCGHGRATVTTHPNVAVTNGISRAYSGPNPNCNQQLLPQNSGRLKVRATLWMFNSVHPGGVLVADAGVHNNPEGDHTAEAQAAVNKVSNSAYAAATGHWWIAYGVEYYTSKLATITS